MYIYIYIIIYIYSWLFIRILQTNSPGLFLCNLGTTKARVPWIWPIWLEAWHQTIGSPWSRIGTPRIGVVLCFSGDAADGSRETTKFRSPAWPWGQNTWISRRKMSGSQNHHSCFNQTCVFLLRSLLKDSWPTAYKIPWLTEKRVSSSQGIVPIDGGRCSNIWA